MKKVIATIVIGLVLLTHAYAAEGMLDDQQTDPQFIQSCLPLVEKQWQYHQLNDHYQSTHILYAQTGSDFFTTDTKSNARVSRQDYHVAIAFVRKDRSYDLSFLNCSIKFDGSAEISQQVLDEQSSTAASRDTERVARIQLSTLALHSWVDPYVDQPGGSRTRWEICGHGHDILCDCPPGVECQRPVR